MKDIQIGKELSEEEIQETLGPLAVIYVHQKACPRCGPVKDLVQALAYEYKGLRFYSIEATDPNLEFCQRIGIDETPSVVVFMKNRFEIPMTDPVKITNEIKKAAHEEIKQREGAVEL